MLVCGCLGRLKLTRQTTRKRNEGRNQRETGAVVSFAIMFLESE